MQIPEPDLSHKNKPRFIAARIKGVRAIRESFASKWEDRNQDGFSKGRRLRPWLVLFLTVVLCNFLDRRDIRGLGFTYFDQYFYSLSMQLASRHNLILNEWIKKNIVIIEINDNTFNPDNGEHLPGPPVARSHQAKVLSDLKRSGARLIVYDLIFRQPSSQPADDAAFANAASQPGPPVVWAGMIENAEVSARLVPPFTPLFKASPYYGHVLSAQESEKLVVQNIQSVYEINGKRVPSLSFEAVRVISKVGQAPLQRTEDGWKAGTLYTPDFLNINYCSSEVGSPFTIVPFEQVYNGLVDDPFYKENNFFKDKIIILGDATLVGNDYRNTPVGYMPGVQIQAQAISSLLMAHEGIQPFIIVASEEVRFFSIILLAALSCWASAFLPIFRAATFILVLSVVYVSLSVYFFVSYYYALHTMAPLLAINLPPAFILVDRGLSAEKEKAYIRDMLQRYVSPSVANFLLLHPEHAVFRSEQVNATVLFADLRGFTGMTRGWPPAKTLGMLNQYFQAMSEVIFRHEGTVDKFLGDGIMAVFGAPLRYPDHAQRAVTSAIEMQQSLLELQEIWSAQGLPLIEMGIGISSGEMVVGNMGYEQRTDFSVIGDTVNLAARLESINKELDSQIIFSQSTWDAINGECVVPLQGPIAVSVRGHELPINVYTITFEPAALEQKEAL